MKHEETAAAAPLRRRDGRRFSVVLLVQAHEPQQPIDLDQYPCPLSKARFLFMEERAVRGFVTGARWTGPPLRSGVVTHERGSLACTR
eukprot:scaffold8307_cov119-Isochrysis_galbana.AAC.8